MEDVVKKIRSVLISEKGKTDLKNLQRDYRTLMGEDIPYRKCGYPSLEQFIKNCNSLKLISNSNGVYVEAIQTADSKHMMDLISKQKSSGRKRSRRLPPRHFPRARTAPRHQKRAPVSTGQKWRTTYLDQSRPREHVHQQFVVPNEQLSPGGNVQQRLNRGSASSPPLSTTASVSDMTSKMSMSSRLTRSLSSPNSVQSREKTIPNQSTARLQLKNTTTLPPQAVSQQSAAFQQALKILTPSDPSSSRSRMRSHRSFPSPTSPTLISTPVMFPSMPGAIMASGNMPRMLGVMPSLNQVKINELTKEGIAHFDETNSACRWSSSDDSSPQRPNSNNSLTRSRLSSDEFPNISGLSMPSSQSTSNQTVKTPVNNKNSINNNNNSIMSDPVIELQNLVRALGLEDPVIRINQRQTKRKGVCLYDCCIKVDNHSYSSYPRDCSTANAARLEAANEAISDLTDRYSQEQQRQNRRLLVATVNDVLTRIPPIIQRHFHGVWASQLELDYEDKYKEQLPENWLALLDTLPTISVEPTLDRRFVLKHGKKEKLPNGQQSSNDLPTAQSQHLLPDISVPLNKIRLTDSGWIVQVTYAASTVEIWCRQVDGDIAEQYGDSVGRMQSYYEGAGGAEHATTVVTGGFYVVPFEGCWSRVRVLSAGEHDVNCFFIDFGDEHVVARSDIYVLKREFARDQEQAFVCRLTGLEELANMKATQSALQDIDGEMFHAKPIIDDMPDDQNDPAAISIILFKHLESADDEINWDEYDEKYNVNHYLIQRITSESVPEIDANDLNRVYVTHATNDGDIYVQLQCDAFAKLTELISIIDNIDFEQIFPDQRIPATGTADASPEMDAKKLYLARWVQTGGDGQLYRAKIIDRSPCGQYGLLYFIDYGNTQIISLNKDQPVYPLDKISEVLNAFPPLAKRVRLNLDAKRGRSKNDDGFAEKILTLMPSDTLVLLKVIRLITESDGTIIPICEMFRRSGSNSELFSISASLSYGSSDIESNQDDAANNIEDGNNNDKSTQLAKKLERLKSVSSSWNTTTKPVPSTGELCAPELPQTGSELDVHVPFAVNPYNFFVQPYQSAVALKDLMKSLQSRYEDANNHERIQLSDVIPGKIYASKHNDGIWYRTSVIKVINSGSISVFYCDFGYYANLTVGQLVPLDVEFLQLPYQAIKARLAGVQPRDTKWTMDDCQHFVEIVKDNTFVSIINAKQQDELYKCDTILILNLIDTSTSQDVVIANLLIDKGIAAASPEK